MITTSSDSVERGPWVVVTGVINILISELRG